jgi:hypothetical protein
MGADQRGVPGCDWRRNTNTNGYCDSYRHCHVDDNTDLHANSYRYCYFHG